MTAIAETLSLLLKDHLAVNGYDEKAAAVDPLPRFGRDFVQLILAELTAKDAKIATLLAACKAALEHESSVRFFAGDAEGDDFAKQLRAAIALAEQEQTDE